MRVLLPLLMLVLVSCGVFDPRLGMTEEAFKRSHMIDFDVEPLSLVAAQDSMRVYETGNVFYYFRSGVLEQVDQGQLFEQRIRLTLD